MCSIRDNPSCDFLFLSRLRVRFVLNSSFFRYVHSCSKYSLKEALEYWLLATHQTWLLSIVRNELNPKKLIRTHILPFSDWSFRKSEDIREFISLYVPSSISYALDVFCHFSCLVWHSVWLYDCYFMNCTCVRRWHRRFSNRVFCFSFCVMAFS